MGLALVGGLVILAVKVCLFLFVLFCRIVIPFVAGVVVLAFAGLVLWAVGAAVMGIVKAVRSRAGVYPFFERRSASHPDK